MTRTSTEGITALGFATKTVPILLDLDRLRQPAVPALEWVLQDGLTNICSWVGWCQPSGSRTIRLAEHYKRYVDVA